MKTAILSNHIFLPILGAVVIIFLGKINYLKSIIISKYLALIIASANFLISIFILSRFDQETNQLQFVEKKSWLSEYNINYHLGIDILSLYFIILTTFLSLTCIVASWNSIKEKAREFFALLLLLEGIIIGVLAAADIVLFYLFFETVLVPVFFIIGVWGGENRIYASFKFFLYTLFGSIFFLLAILYMIFYSETADVQLLVEKVPHYDIEIQKWLWAALFMAFAIKVPMWPLHTWLPDAHVQAPTAGSVLLAGVLLKLGGYGFLRFSIPMLPKASIYFADFVIILSIIAVIYTSLVALMQTDMKKMMAYSSVAHMGYVTAGLFTFTVQGIEGSIFTMLSHGLISSALFLCIGVLYDRMHTKEISFYGGLTKKMPEFALFFMIFMLSSVGLPTTSGFIGEFFVLFASFKTKNLYGVLLALGMVLGAAYMLWLYARLMFGQLKIPLAKITDLSIRETTYLASIAIFVLLLGIMPNIINNNLSKFVENLVNKINLVKEMPGETNYNISDE
ncbi:MAG: NADH-quinone oxidoreductase subunit M [Candidatus Midichloria sp.]|nr:MAG: NADH-quinone oxidoreductase subunit M [Candidatus Midichloria sp.]